MATDKEEVSETGSFHNITYLWQDKTLNYQYLVITYEVHTFDAINQDLGTLLYVFDGVWTTFDRVIAIINLKTAIY